LDISYAYDCQKGLTEPQNIGVNRAYTPASVVLVFESTVNIVRSPPEMVNNSSTTETSLPRRGIEYYEQLPRDVRAIILSLCIIGLVRLGMSIPW
jgi:hypothetical protein